MGHAARQPSIGASYESRDHPGSGGLMDLRNEAQCLAFLRLNAASRRAIEGSIYFGHLARQDPIGSIHWQFVAAIMRSV
jgi:hypothetical protein